MRTGAAHAFPNNLVATGTTVGHIRVFSVYEWTSTYPAATAKPKLNVLPVDRINPGSDIWISIASSSDTLLLGHDHREFVYISEAENYDKALVESWKSDMEGLLIFLQGQYKALSPDQGTITVAFLAKTSLQLDPRFNAWPADISALETFTPTTASLACNTLCMYKVVEFIPLLLHVLLLLFFAGLVAFLHPVNIALMIITAALLGVISGAYTYLKILPIFSSDSPYRTALSNIVWGSFRCLSGLLCSRRRFSSDDESIIPHQPSPFSTKTIPTMIEIMTRDAIQKSTKRDERDARAIVWTVRSLKDDNEFEPFVEALQILYGDPLEESKGSWVPAIPVFFLTTSHLTSAYSLARWNGFRSLSALTREIISVLEKNTGNSTSTRPQDHRVLLQMAQCEAEHQGYTNLSGVISSLIALHPVDTPVLVQRARDALMTFDHAAYDILTEYLCNCAALKYEPYEFDTTCRMMVERFPVPPTPQLESKLRTAFSNIIQQHRDQLHAHRKPHHIDQIIGMILNLLPDSLDAQFTRPVVLYLMCRPIPSEAVSRGLGRCKSKFMGSLLTAYLASNPRDVMHATLAEIFWLAVDRSASVLAHFDEETLAVVSGAPHFFISSCAIAVLKTRILMAVAELASDQLDALMDRLQIPNLASEISTSMGTTTTAQWKEGFFPIFLDFLEQTDELSMLNDWNQQRAERVSRSLQRRFATWFLKNVNGTSVTSRTQLMNAIIYWENKALLESLDDHVVRKTICEALNVYLVTISDKQGEFVLYNRILRLLVLFDPPSENIPIFPTVLTAPLSSQKICAAVISQGLSLVADHMYIMQGKGRPSLFLPRLY
ncbi:hypothetical protein C8R44DRAFT_916382 [Mycena epipterygia]|nr:hypothetical protein C8R44DRAFT_916382 [Mycena epipterygia]